MLLWQAAYAGEQRRRTTQFGFALTEDTHPDQRGPAAAAAAASTGIDIGEPAGNYGTMAAPIASTVTKTEITAPEASRPSAGAHGVKKNVFQLVSCRHAMVMHAMQGC